jgi:hypothetical protein
LLPFACLFFSSQLFAGADTDQQNRLDALASLLEARQTQAAQILELEVQLANAGSEGERAELEAQLQRMREQLQQTRTRFTTSATGVDTDLFEEKEKEPFSWESALGKILEPILAEVEAATARSRKLAQLNKEIDRFTEQEEAAVASVNRLRETLSIVEDPQLLGALREELAQWEQRVTVATNQANAVRLQLEDFQAESEGLVDDTTHYIRQFLSQRGLNLLLGIGAALLVFLSLRFVLFLLRKLRRGGNPDSLGNRVFVLLTNLLSILGAIAALLIAFSAAGDLFLLGILLVFLLGAAWAGIQVIPQFIESLKILLNIGMVKENQRILFDGIPWNVASLGFSCRLENKDLDNGVQVLPVKRLVGLHSRPWCADELCFPIQRGEWVRLSDGTTGCSVNQNPGTVTLELPGGARTSYSTPDFLALAPTNLSRKGFRIQTRFGIDYRHQEIATTKVIEWFTESLQTQLPNLFGADSIRHIEVQFALAGSSSLNYEIEVDVDGSVAALFEKGEYAIQRILVQTCQQHKLSIPFPQITVHKAE